MPWLRNEALRFAVLGTGAVDTMTDTEMLGGVSLLLLLLLLILGTGMLTVWPICRLVHTIPGFAAESCSKLIL